MAATKPHLAEDFRRQVADLGIILHELELHHDLESFVTDLQDRLRQRYNGSLHPEAMTRPMFVRTAFDVYADHYYEAMDDMRDLIGQEPMYTIKRAYLFTRWKYRDLYRSLARGATAI